MAITPELHSRNRADERYHAGAARTQSVRPAVRWAGVLAATVVAFYICLIGFYRFVDPPGSNLILAEYLVNGEVKRDWVPLTEISPNVVKAVVMSEDAKFCRHWGVDWGELAAAIKSRNGRGGSTISMQTAKNLFLWPAAHYLRKAIELPLAMVMDFMWPKRRMLEIYLNIAEWAPGVFGIEAAAQHHFGRSARRLTSRQAALLAAALPNPHVRTAGDPGRRTARKARVISKRMAASDAYTGCLLAR